MKIISLSMTLIHYILMNIECTQESLDELENLFYYNDAVLRNMVIKRKEAITEPSVMMAQKEDKCRGDNRG